MQLDITAIDKNFLIGSQIDRTDVSWHNIPSAPFAVHGLAVVEKDKFYRLPEDLIEQVNAGVTSLARHTSGGRIRFRTDSSFIAFRAKSFGGGLMSHMPLTGISGADLFADGVSITTFRPNNPRCDWFEGIANIRGEGVKDIEINLGLYNGFKEIWVGIEQGCVLETPSAYTFSNPIVYYGSSITQGGCASKPGNAYPAFISRWLDSDFINLGFSGSAKGEPIMAQYIASLKMSAFVLDYDHNAPTVDHLAATHYPFYKIIREAQKDLPIIMVSMPDTDKNPEDADKRREVIMNTFMRARSEGDSKVWFVDGRMLWGGRDRDCCTMDGTHPNDIGFYRMAEGILPSVKAALGLTK